MKKKKKKRKNTNLQLVDHNSKIANSTEMIRESNALLEGGNSKQNKRRKFGEEGRKDVADGDLDSRKRSSKKKKKLNQDEQGKGKRRLKENQCREDDLELQPMFSKSEEAETSIPSNRQLNERSPSGRSLGFADKIAEEEAEDPRRQTKSEVQQSQPAAESRTTEATVQVQARSEPDGGRAKYKAPLTWDESFEELKEYSQKHGHANVRAKYPRLGMWVVNQRGTCKSKLTAEQIEKLNSIGFNWETKQERFERQWNAMFQRYRDYVGARIGISICEPGFFEEDQRLKVWVRNQQSLYRDGTLQEDRKQRLEQVGFLWVRDYSRVGLAREWKQHDARWDTMLEKLLLFKDKEGHTMIQPDHPDEALFRWVHRQRLKQSKATLKSERKETLDKINFVWDMTDHCDAETSLKQRQWDRMYERLVKFYEDNGHTHCGKASGDPALAQWVFLQREKYAAKTLDPRRAGRLDNLNFSYNPVFEDRWNEMYKELQLFHQEHGHVQVPSEYSRPESPSRLGQWVVTQRTDNTRGNLSEDRCHKLNSLGFVWDTKKEKWYRMYGRLVAWKDLNGHCNVPDQYDPDPELRNWVKVQRGLVRGSKKGALAPEKKKLLDGLGFIWKGIANWGEKYAELEEYFKENNHSNVPFYHAALGRWVSDQRKKKIAGKLAADKEDKLNKLNFSWESHEESKERAWNESYQKLKDYMKQHKLETAPQKARGNKNLGKWMARQREVDKKGTLPRNRRGKLEEIGFVWEGKFKVKS